VALRPAVVPTPGGRWTDGVHELQHAFGDLYPGVLRVRIKLLCGVGVLRDLLRRSCDLGLAIDRQPSVAAIFPLWTARVALAEFDILAPPALQAVQERSAAVSSPAGGLDAIGSRS